MPKRGVTIDGTKLLAARLRRGLSMRELAALVTQEGHPLHYAVLSKFENNLRRPTPDTLAALCKALCLRPSDLHDDERTAPVALYPASSLAKRLGISRSTIASAVRRGRLETESLRGRPMVIASGQLYEDFVAGIRR